MPKIDSLGRGSVKRWLVPTVGAAQLMLFMCRQQLVPAGALPDNGCRVPKFVRDM